MKNTPLSHLTQKFSNKLASNHNNHTSHPKEIKHAVTNRPQTLEDFIGQANSITNLKIFINAAKNRGEALDHILFNGPPGLGKTTLANIIAKELSVNIKITSGPLLTKPLDIAALLTGLKTNDILFIDEIHRLPKNVEETLYPAMEDYVFDLMIGTGPGARPMRMELPKFTLIGATTRAGLLSNPLRDRFGINIKMEFYKVYELQKIISHNALLSNIAIEKDATQAIAQRARGTPRIAIRLLRRVRDFYECVPNIQKSSIVNNANINEMAPNKQTFSQANIVKQFVIEALNKIGINDLGLDTTDIKYLQFLASHAKKPVGISNISAALSEDTINIEDLIEPYLIQIGFIRRTNRGRVLTPKALQYVKDLYQQEMP